MVKVKGYSYIKNGKRINVKPHNRSLPSVNSGIKRLIPVDKYGGTKMLLSYNITRRGKEIK